MSDKIRHVKSDEIEELQAEVTQLLVEIRRLRKELSSKPSDSGHSKGLKRDSTKGTQSEWY